MKVEFLLDFLVSSSEKAASLARKVRSEKELFSLLVQEKSGTDKNERFDMDFKTLADVLIQETLRYDLKSQIPELAEQLFGEESNKFTNSLGESISVDVQENIEGTTDLLCKVLNGNLRAAQLLSQIVHADVFDFKITDNIDRSQLANQSVDCSNIAIWIDPIDGTAEYISGNSVLEEANSAGIVNGGLVNVTVLIGAFFIDTGLPFLGCINQPFAIACKDAGSSSIWQGRLFYGVSLESFKLTNIPNAVNSSQGDSPIKIISSVTDLDYLSSALPSPDYILYTAPGAGYKLLCVIVGLVDAYILSKPNTFQWDTCGPHAILASRGGGILRFNDIKSSHKEIETIAELLVRYEPLIDKDGSNISNLNCCNKEGILAYRDESVLLKIIQALKPNTN